MGRKGRGQADRRLESGRQIYRRGRRGDPAVPIRPADHPQKGPQDRGAVQRHDSSATDHTGLGTLRQGGTTMRWGEIIRRLVLIPPTLIGVAVIVFVLLRVVPGDPIAMMIPPGATPADIERLRAFYGLDQPILQQFITWFGQALRGDFGRSISVPQGVFELVRRRLPATLELALLATLIAVVLGVITALIGLQLRGRRAGWAVDGGGGAFHAQKCCCARYFRMR